MGNNTTFIIGKPKNNSSGSTNNNNQNSGSSLLAFFRPGQPWEDVYIQGWAAVILQLVIIILNIMLLIVFHQRLLKTIPHLIFQNIIIVDLLAALLPGTVWTFAIQLNNLPWQLVNDVLCDTHGFLNSALYNTFLLTAALISLTQFLCISAPELYNRIFKHFSIARAYILGVWVFSSFLAIFPVISKWGSYGPYDASCWMTWAAGSDIILSFSVFNTVWTLGPAYLLTIVALVLTMLKARGNQPTSSDKNLTIATAIQLLFSSSLWLGLTIINADYIANSYRAVNFHAVLCLFFFYYSRGLWNPLICLIVNKDIRTSFIDVIFRCRCNCCYCRRRIAPDTEITMQARKAQDST